ncbi:MAG: tryptophan synthase subunit alpha, partial [Rhodospirillaceae bacterium]
YNPIYIHGPEAFAKDAAEAGADGVIIVDMPPEECGELVPYLNDVGLHFVFLATPTTDAARLPVVLEQAGGFVYYVSITGITGTRSADAGVVEKAVDQIRAHTDLPVAIGFGVNTPEQAAEMSRIGDAAVVGSAIVKRIGAGEDVLGFVGELASAVREPAPEKQTA